MVHTCLPNLVWTTNFLAPLGSHFCLKSLHLSWLLSHKGNDEVDEGCITSSNKVLASASLILSNRPNICLRWSRSTNIWSFFFDHAKWHAGSQFPYQGWSPHLLQWKRGILTTGPTGNSQHLVLNTTLHTSAKQCSNTASLNIPCPSMPSLCSKPIAKVSSMVNGEGRGSSFSDI